MIRTVIEARDASEGAAEWQRADVGGDCACGAPSRDGKHRQGEIPRRRLETVVGEGTRGQSGATRQIKERAIGRRVATENRNEQLAHGAEKSVAESLIVGVGESSVGLVVNG